MALRRPDSTGDAPLLSKKARLQELVLEVLQEHQRDGTLPTNGRFVWYELVAREAVDKTKARGHPGAPPRGIDQDVADALLAVREQEIVPWWWIVDETRNLDVWQFGSSIAAEVARHVDEARVDAWDGQPPPLILCESRSLAGVLKDLAADYLAPIGSTNGQAHGYLVTQVAPLLEDDRAVIYLGDFDFSGGHIEDNSRRILEGQVGPLDWHRVAITPAQVRKYRLTVIQKYDARRRSSHAAVETEALGQARIVRFLRDHLDRLLPEPLVDVRVREQHEREQLHELLDGAERT